MKLCLLAFNPARKVANLITVFNRKTSYICNLNEVI